MGTARFSNIPDLPTLMDGFFQAVRHTIRLLAKSPGFSVTAVLVIGFGIGSNTAVFTLIDSVALSPLPFPNPDQLVEVSVVRSNNPFDALSYPDFIDLRREQRAFDQLAVSFADQVDMTGHGAAERLSVNLVSASLFKVTGRPFLLGRPFSDAEDRQGGPKVAVISEHLWQTGFQGDPDIMGKILTLAERPFEVIGVCPTQVDDLNQRPSDVYLPSNAATISGYNLSARNELIWQIVGRLKAGVSRTQAQTDLARTYANLTVQFPETHNGRQITVRSLLDRAIRGYLPTIWMLGAAAGCLLLISAANIANLLLARGLQRRKEMAIRAALGASRWHLSIQILGETTVLSALGALFGIVVAELSISLIRLISPENLYRVQTTQLGLQSLGFISLLLVFMSLTIGLPLGLALSKIDTRDTLKDEGERAATPGVAKQRTQSIVVVCQVALTFVLLAATGLLISSFRAAQSIPLGFNPHHRLTAMVAPTAPKYVDPSVAHRFFDQVFGRVRNLPGVTNAAMNLHLPFYWDWGYPAQPFHVKGLPDTDRGKEPLMNPQAISGGYFKTLEIPFLEGRDFDERDRSGQPHVAIVDEAFAKHFFPGESALGKQIEDHLPYDVAKTWTIVGVVKSSLLNHPDNVGSPPFSIYFPYDQRVIGIEWLILQTERDTASLIPEIKAAVAAVDPDVVVTQFKTFDDLVAGKYMMRRLGTFVVGLFSCAALFLSITGLYGVLAYAVSQRTREIGIRIALGARSFNIMRLVLRQGALVSGIGLSIGFVAVLLIGRFVQSALYNVSPTDSITLGTSALVLTIATLFACLLPAVRATRVDPVRALRE
jgi:putative ABC transport system permease protein